MIESNSMVVSVVYIVDHSFVTRHIVTCGCRIVTHKICSTILEDFGWRDAHPLVRHLIMRHSRFRRLLLVHLLPPHQKSSKGRLRGRIGCGYDGGFGGKLRFRRASGRADGPTNVQSIGITLPVLSAHFAEVRLSSPGNAIDWTSKGLECRANPNAQDRR